MDSSLICQGGQLADYKIVSSGTGRIAFMVNGWKNQAENAFALGWTDSTEAEMIRMQRVRATADAGKDVMPLLMQKAAAEQAGVTSQENLPPAIRGLNVVAAVSVGSGSACVLFTKEPEFIRIDYLLANTQAAGQSMAQQTLIRHVSDLAKQSGIAEVRLAASTLPTLYAAPAQLGFEELSPGSPWLRLARS
jgi:hypothetical protein